MKRGYVIILMIVLCFGIRAENTDSLFVAKRSSFIEAYSAAGTVFNTNEFVQDMKGFQALSLRYAFASNGDSWDDFAFNMPYVGIGFYMPFFNTNPGLGNPYSIYLFRGSTLAQFSDKFKWNLEINLGFSSHWDHYDLVDNPNNIAVGTANNVHVGLRSYLDYLLSEKWNLKLGVDLAHFSNGSWKMPNKGMNMGGLSLGLAYQINPPKKEFIARNSSLKPPIVQKHIEHDVQFFLSKRQRKFPVDAERYIYSQYDVDYDFRVFGLTYSPLFVRHYKYKWGPAVRITYDESLNAMAWKERNPETGELDLFVEQADVSGRLSLGMAMRGEIAMPGVSIYALLGFENTPNKAYFDWEFFQLIGVKAHINKHLYACFGISAQQFSVAQYITFGVGYNFFSHHTGVSNTSLHSSFNP